MVCAAYPAVDYCLGGLLSVATPPLSYLIKSLMLFTWTTTKVCLLHLWWVEAPVLTSGTMSSKPVWVVLDLDSVIQYICHPPKWVTPENLILINMLIWPQGTTDLYNKEKRRERRMLTETWRANKTFQVEFLSRLKAMNLIIKQIINPSNYVRSSLFPPILSTGK